MVAGADWNASYSWSNLIKANIKVSYATLACLHVNHMIFRYDYAFLVQLPKKNSKLKTEEVVKIWKSQDSYMKRTSNKYGELNSTVICF